MIKKYQEFLLENASQSEALNELNAFKVAIEAIRGLGGKQEDRDLMKDLLDEIKNGKKSQLEDLINMVKRSVGSTKYKDDAIQKIRLLAA